MGLQFQFEIFKCDSKSIVFVFFILFYSKDVMIFLFNIQSILSSVIWGKIEKFECQRTKNSNLTEGNWFFF